MKIINIRFDGGGENPPVDRYVAVAASGEEFDRLFAEISDSFASYMENAFDPKYNEGAYDDAVRHVMDACGIGWSYVHDDIRVLRI